MRFTGWAALALAASGCGTTGRELVSYPASGHGTAAAEFDAGDARVTLEVAQVALGPIYFCATAAASADLCSVAVQELTSTATLDALDPGPQPLGNVEGVSGSIRSLTFDYGISWFNTQTTPVAAAAAVGGHSAHFEGLATRGGTSRRFVADVDVVPQFRGSRAVQALRVTADVPDADARLDVTVDSAAWWAGVDFGPLWDAAEEPIVIAPGSAAHNALVVAMTATIPPTFIWTIGTGAAP